MKVSVIVPVYNVESYLEKCLCSLARQTLTDFEVLIVNDGSPDQSQTIIDYFCEQYAFMKCIKKENGGLSDARNVGIQYATGEYIAFVDSDDYVEETMYEELYRKAISQDFDLVVCDFKEIYLDHIVGGTSRVAHDIRGVYEVKKVMCDFYPSAWNKLYKRRILEIIQFKKNIWFEDVEFSYRMFPYLTSIGVVSKPFYNYIQREGSISKSNDPRIFHILDNWNGIVLYYKEHGFYEEYERELMFNYVRYLYATFTKAVLKFDKKEYVEAIRKAQSFVKATFPKYRHNPLFYRSIKGIYLLVFNMLIARLYYAIKHTK